MQRKLIIEVPSIEDSDALLVPFTVMVAPTKAVLLLSFTVPVTVFCPKTKEEEKSAVSIRTNLIVGDFGISNRFFVLNRCYIYD